MLSVLKSGAAERRSSESQLAKSGISITSFGEILIMSPVQRPTVNYRYQKGAHGKLLYHIVDGGPRAG